MTRKSVLDERTSEAHGSSLAAPTSIVVTIASLAPEPFRVVSPMQAVVQGSDGDYTAVLFDANIGASGETQQEAINNLKDTLIMSFESLKGDDEDSLGPLMKTRKAVVATFVKRN